MKCHLIKINYSVKVAVATLTHEQMIDLLRTSVTVRVVIIPPHEDATPRRCVCVCQSRSDW